MWTPLIFSSMLLQSVSCIEFSNDLKIVFDQALNSVQVLQSKIKVKPTFQTEALPAIPLQNGGGNNVQFSIQQSNQENIQENYDLEFFDDKYGDLVNLLPQVADALELAIFDIQPEPEELQDFVDKCNELSIKLDSSDSDKNESIEIMTLYALEILQIIISNAEKNQNVASNNLKKIQRIIDSKRQSLKRAQNEIPGLQRSEVTIKNNIKIAQDKIKDLNKKIKDKNSKIKGLENARLGTSFCLPCLVGFTVAIDNLKKDKKKLQKDLQNNQISLAGQTLQFGITKAKLFAFRHKIKKLEKELLEVNGLKNDLIEGRDNFKAVKASLKIIQNSANQTITLIEDCQENLDECDTVIVIRTKIEALKSEGKTIWTFLIEQS
eukprot:03895.XXX_186883_188126_1 [CDS] Oithona nana genome sequencing.